MVGSELFVLEVMLRFELLQGLIVQLVVLLRLVHVADGGYTDLELVLGPRICHDLPVVNALIETQVSEEIPEDVGVFLDVDLPAVWTDFNIFSLYVLLLLRSIPHPLRDDHAYHLTLRAEIEQVVNHELLPFVVQLGVQVAHSLPQSLPLFFLQLQLLLAFKKLFFIGKVLVEEDQDLVLVPRFHGLLQPEHLIADVITYLDGLVLVLELFPTPVLKNHLALFVCTLVLLAPLFVVLDLGEQDELFAVVARYL